MAFLGLALISSLCFEAVGFISTFWGLSPTFWLCVWIGSLFHLGAVNDLRTSVVHNSSVQRDTA